MNKSIVQQYRLCFFCGRAYPLEKHHIFGGANRKKSEKYGLWVYLCHRCHNEPPDGVHFNKENMDKLRRIGQKAFMAAYPEKDFLKEFGKNYI